MLNSFKNLSHSELLYAVYQCARFYNDPKCSHEQAVRRMIQYIVNTRGGEDNC